MKTEFVSRYERSLVSTCEWIKIDLIRNRKELPNPAAYAIETELNFPLEETLLPVAKRSLVRYIS